MTISTRVMKTLSGRRMLSIDPAKHFAVHIQDGYADPVTREQFLAAIHMMGGSASLLKKLAAASMRDACTQCETGKCNLRLAQALGRKLADAQTLQCEFETFIKQLIFSDQNAFSVVEQARKGMAEAIEAIRVALAAIDRAVADQAA